MEITLPKASPNPIYFIPVEDKTVIYAPHKPMTFIGNDAMVQWIKRWQQDPHNMPEDDTKSLLQRIGFFSPDQRIVPTFADDKPFKPTIAVLLLTTACNLNCIYCYASAGMTQGKFLSLETGKQVIDQVCQNAIDLQKNKFSLSLHGGGEPTVAAPLMQELVHYAHTRKLPCSISLTSNGYFTEKQAEGLLWGISEVSLSFDGMAEIQNRQRPGAGGQPSFDRVFATLKAIEKLGIPYGIRMSVMDDSIEYLPKNIQFFCENTRCNVFQVEPVFNSGRARMENRALKNNDRFVDAFMAAMEVAWEHSRHMYYSGVRPWLVTNEFCLAPREALIVNHNGELTMCYEVYDREHELGELFFYGQYPNGSAKSIDLSSREELFNRIRARQSRCIEKQCYCYPHCAGDCPPKALLAQVDEVDGFSPRCDLNRKLTLEVLLFYIEKSGGIWRGEKNWRS